MLNIFCVSLSAQNIYLKKFSQAEVQPSENVSECCVILLLLYMLPPPESGLTLMAGTSKTEISANITCQPRGGATLDAWLKMLSDDCNLSGRVTATKKRLKMRTPSPPQILNVTPIL